MVLLFDLIKRKEAILIDDKEIKDIFDLVDRSSKLQKHEEMVIDAGLLDEFFSDESSGGDAVINAQRYLFNYNCSVYLANGEVKIIKLK